MIVSYAPLGEPLASELIASLIELTAVARKASSAPPERWESVANDLLTCVLTLCKAERGAILLHEDQPRLGPFEPASATQEGAQAFRLLALHQMRAEDASALLAPMTTPGAPVPAPDTVCWLVYRLSLDEGGPDEAQNCLALQTGMLFDLADKTQSALLIVGVKDQLAQGKASSSLHSRCSLLLPLIATAFEAVIATLLLKERVNALEREEVRDALKGMELLKAELLGTVSHELRGPLASIKGYAATLLRHEHRLAREERHQFLLAIHEASDRLAVIVARLLDLSQLETGRAVFERSPVDLARLVREAIAAMEEQLTTSLPNRFVFTLRLENADGTTDRSVPLILADPRRLREMVDQLLENAVKFSPGGGLVTLTIRPVIQVSPGEKTGDTPQTGHLNDPGRARVPCNMLEMCVTDNGQGIPAEHLERIFERFHRVDTRLTRETGGLGLGLTTCRRIVELHGGNIWAENRSTGKGSAFYVQLPINQAIDLS
jgi:signal transduction histidine kinase